MHVHELNSLVIHIERIQEFISSRQHQLVRQLNCRYTRTPGLHWNRRSTPACHHVAIRISTTRRIEAVGNRVASALFTRHN
jgi:hypothetical protein